MLTVLLIVLLGLALFVYVAMPLLNPRGADPLPVEHDPVATDLEEEKLALFRAIRELDGRDDLATERREQLRARYEAKAARVLRALDERANSKARQPHPRPASRRLPLGALTLLGLAVTISTALSAYVLPRVGENSTVTTFFSDDLSAARELRDLQRAAERNPSGENLLALADAYWRVEDAEKAQETYLRAVEEAGAQSALAYRRLGFLSLQSDLEQALAYLERARRLEPGDPDTLYVLGEINFALGEFEAAEDAWLAYQEGQGQGGDQQVAQRLELVRSVAPLAARVQQEPNEENLLALADAYWQADERQRAVEAYFQVLVQHDPNDPVALGRTGQLLFLSGRSEDAIALMERAAMSDQVGPQTLLFLGNAYYSEERYFDAVAVWERYVNSVGPGQAGRVPGLIEDARARAEGGEARRSQGSAGADDALARAPLAEDGRRRESEDPSGQAASALDQGEAIFARSCAGCHGQGGAGGSGPRLAGSDRAANAGNVRNAVTYGRGMMPGFAAVLAPAQIDAVVGFVTETLAPR